MLLTGKNFMYNHKKKNKELFINNFLQNLTWNLKLEEQILIQQGKLLTFNERYIQIHVWFSEIASQLYKCLPVNVLLVVLS